MDNKIKITKNVPLFFRGGLGVLLWGVILCVLAACSQDLTEGQEEPVYQGGEPVTILFTVSEQAPEQGNDIVNMRSTSAAGNPQTDVIQVNDDLYMYTALTKDREPVKLRSAFPLEAGVKVRIVAYSTVGVPPTNVGYADYEVIAGGLLIPDGTPHISLAAGSYKFVAYSFNSTAALPAFAETTAAITNQDIVRGETTATVTTTSPSFSVHITMYHLFSQVTVDAKLGSGAPIVLNSFNVAPYIYTYKPTLTILSGLLTPGLIDSMMPVKNTSLSTATNWISDSVFVFTNATSPTRLKFTNLALNQATPLPGPFFASYTDALTPGTKYTVQAVFHRASGGTADRITIEGSGSNAKLVITRMPSNLGLFFKFGSVVGINRNPGAFATNKIVFNPLSSPGLITNYATVPLYTAPADEAIRDISTNDYHNLANIRAGKGDPCRLIGMTLAEINSFPNDDALYAREAALALTRGPDGQPVGGWRTPKVIENQRFSGRDAFTTVTTHWWNQSGAPVSPWGVAGGEFHARNSNNGAADSTKFLPRVDYLDITGGYATASGGDSYYWSNDPGSNNVGISLCFSTNSIHPVQNGTLTSDGHAVRCIQKKPYSNFIEVGYNDWNNGGTLGGGQTGQGDVQLW